MLHPLVISDALRQMKQFYQRDRIVAYYPSSEVECTEPGCGHDAVLDAKKKIDCAVCDARGYITTWTTQILVARVVKPNPLSFSMEAGGSIVAETADLVLYIGQHDVATVTRIRTEERAYFDIDGTTYRPDTVTPIGVGNVAEYRVECTTYKPS
jgi:hypothetical protein